MVTLRSLTQVLERSRGAQFLFAFAVVFALKSHTLFQLPVWDTAMGLFPAAITLAQNGLDLFELAGMENYRAGGPNVHGASPVTFVTALVLKLTGGGSLGLAVLHLLHFSMAALSLVVLYGLAMPLFGAPSSLLLCVCALLHPVFSAQVGFMYLEVPLFLCAVSALAAWTERRFAVAIVWSTLALAIKQMGIVVPATLALATLMERGPLSARLKRVAWIGLPPAALVVAWHFIVIAATREGPGEFRLLPLYGFPADRIAYYIAHYARRFLFNVPDLALFLVAFFALAGLHGRRIVAALHREPTDPSQRDPKQKELLVLGLSGLLIALFLVLSYAALPAIARYAIILPRYFVMVLPFLLLWMGYGVRELFPRWARASTVSFGVLAAVFAVNGNGVLYPNDVDTEGPGNDPALTERSNAYRRLQALQIAALRFVEELPRDTWVYYGHYEYYLFSYPEMGWVRGSLPHGHSLSLEPVPDLERADAYPPCVYVLYNYPWAGGKRLRELLQRAEASGFLSSDVVRVFRDAPYEITLHRIRRGAEECPL